MKIAILGSIYINVEVQLESVFDQLFTNKGEASVYCGSPALDLAKKLLADGNEVIFITSVNTQMHVPVCRLLQKFRLDTKYVAWEPNGVGFKVNLTDCSVHEFESVVCGEEAIKLLENMSDDIFNGLDMLVTDYVEPRAAKLCSTYNTKLSWLADPDDLARFDSEDVYLQSYKDVPVVSLDNYKEIIS